MDNKILSSFSSASADVNDREFFTKLRAGIERHLAEMNKVVDSISQMRGRPFFLAAINIITKGEPPPICGERTSRVIPD